MKKTALSSLLENLSAQLEQNVRLKEMPTKIDQIGEGVNGPICSYQLSDNRFLAGKMAKIHLFSRSERENDELSHTLQDALNEVNALKQLDHDRILKFVGCYWDEKKFFFFTELMIRGSIKDQLCSSPLPENRALRYIIQTAEGLSFLHSRHPKPIVHRDIKCANLLLDENDNVKLGDFGLAMSISLKDDVTCSTQRTIGKPKFAGTLLFAAPEVQANFTGKSVRYGRKADVWSLACTIVEMLTGSAPHYQNYRRHGFFDFVRLNSTDDEHFQYSGILVPNASLLTRDLLNYMFAREKKFRPSIDNVLNYLHRMNTTLGIDQSEEMRGHTKVAAKQEEEIHQPMKKDHHQILRKNRDIFNIFSDDMDPLDKYVAVKSNVLQQIGNELSESQLKALDEHQAVFCENLDLTTVLVQLERNGHVRSSDVQMITVEDAEYTQRRKLIDLIKVGPPSLYAAFQEALFFSGQINLAELLSDKMLEGSMSLMRLFYPDWWSDSKNKETVCIPVCLDVDKNRYLGASDCKASNFDSETFSRKERQWSGQAAEDSFMKAFQLLYIGGVLVFGFDTMEFASVRRTQKLFKKRRISQIECDFIFIHPLIGIFIIEVKATKGSIEEYSPIYQQAVRMTKKIKEQIPIIYELLIDRKFNIPVYGAVYFPFARVGKFVRDDEVQLIESFNDEDALSLKKVFTEKMTLHSLEEESLIGLKMFASSLAAYRSAECISPVHNALAIHKMLESQSFSISTSKGICLKNSVSLTAEQLTIIECKDRHQIISGPPGTSKTLILLNQALNMSKLDKPGRVFVITFNKACCKMFQRYFEANEEDLKRFPVIDYMLHDVRPEDDLFIDEADLQLKEFVSFIKYRKSGSGFTSVVVTGFRSPQQAINVNEDIDRHKLTFYRHFDLRTVMRGTISIVDTWKQNYPADFRFHMGHSIIGPTVRKEKLEKNDEILNNLQRYISQALRSTAPHNLCVITENRKNCEIIKKFLISNEIYCGSLDEQLDDDSKVVAVAEYTETLSLEWALVFIVTLECADQYESFITIAASRATAKLVIIERYADIREKFGEERFKLKIDEINIFGSSADIFHYLNLISRSNTLCHMVMDEYKSLNVIISQKKDQDSFYNNPKFLRALLAFLSDDCKGKIKKIIEDLVRNFQLQI